MKISNNEPPLNKE